MRIWLITVGEPLPIDSGSPRLLRTGILAGMLRDSGHQVVWWSSVFDHSGKRFRLSTSTNTDNALGYELRLLRGCGYDSNISIKRVRDQREVARDFKDQASLADRPDIIVCAYPTIELCVVAVEFGKQNDIPVVLDIRDLWPDIFENLVPKSVRSLARFALKSMYRNSAGVCSGAAALMGITDAFVDWGVKRSGRDRGPFDAAFPLAYDVRTLPEDKLVNARREWSRIGLEYSDPTFCFFGTLGRQFDIPTVIAAARLLSHTKAKFVICGAGDNLTRFQKSAADLPNVIFPGWVGAAAIRTLMERSKAGLAPYLNEWSFTMSLPNKPIEYMAGGLPVLSSLTGELKVLLDTYHCGRTYPEGDSHALAKVITQFLADEDEQALMAANAKRCFRERFDAGVVYPRMIAHLEVIAKLRIARRLPDTYISIN